MTMSNNYNNDLLFSCDINFCPQSIFVSVKFGMTLFTSVEYTENGDVVSRTIRITYKKWTDLDKTAFISLILLTHKFLIKHQVR